MLRLDLIKNYNLITLLLQLHVACSVPHYAQLAFRSPNFYLLKIGSTAPLQLFPILKQENHITKPVIVDPPNIHL